MTNLLWKFRVDPVGFHRDDEVGLLAVTWDEENLSGAGPAQR
jgi:hypothetical protein